MKNAGIWLTIIGAIAAIWGFAYQSSHKAEGIGALFGVTSDTYKLASASATLGIIAAIVGVVLLIIASTKKTA